MRRYLRETTHAKLRGSPQIAVSHRQIYKQIIKNTKDMTKIIKEKKLVVKTITAKSVASLNKQLAKLGINEKSIVHIVAEVRAINTLKETIIY